MTSAVPHTSLSSSFQVTVQPSGRSFMAQPGETLLGAAIHAGVGLPYGCKDGACGSCKCQKIEGTVVHGPHQDKALSAQEEADGLVLTCCAVAYSDVQLQARQVTDESSYPVRKMPVRVAAFEKKSPDVMQLRLQLPATDTFRYHAGQYVEFLLPGGKFTDHVFSALKEKEILRIEGPFGSFFLREDSNKPLILLAAGTGFAPLKALIEHMQFKGITRPTTLYWGGRRPQDLYLDDWVRARLAQMPQLSYVPVVSDALPEDGWSGRSGLVHQAVLEDFADLSGHQVYACGAPVVVDSAWRAYVQQRGLPSEAFFADAFTSEADKHSA